MQFLLSNFYFEFVNVLKNKRFWRSNLAMIVGCLLFAYAINSCVIQLKLTSPGLTGILLIIYYITDFADVGLLYKLANIPILIIGWRYISTRFVTVNILGAIYFATALDITKSWPVPASLNDDVILLLIWGSVLAGVGSGIYLRYGGSIGGMDIIAIVIKKTVGLPLSTTFILINTLNLICNYFNQDIKVTMYSGIFMFSMTFITIRTQTGFSQRLAILIITSFPEEISLLINKKLERSSTFLKAVGSFKHKETNVIYTIINIVELGRLKNIVYDTDPNALLTVLGTTEVIGQKFISWEEQGFQKSQKFIKKK